MSCTGVGPFTWYLYTETWILIDCIDNDQSSYSFTGITTPGIYNVVVVNDSYSATTQFTITGNESCCWDTTLYQPCNEGCHENGDGVNITKNGDDFQFTVNNNYGAIEIFFKKINDFLGFNSTKNISSTPLDVSVLYSSDTNKGPSVYFDSLIRSYECCPIDPGTEILFTAPCINDPVYKVLKVCNTCNDIQTITGYTITEPCIECPRGYDEDPDGLSCTKIEYTEAIIPDFFYTVTNAAPSVAYGWRGTRFYTPINLLPLPLINTYVTADPVMDQSTALVPVDVTIDSPFWGSSTDTIHSGRMNNGAGIWTEYTASTAQPNNVWIGFSECVNVPTTKEYYLGIAGDNNVRIDINGQTIINLVQSNGGNFQYWHVFPIQLSSGINVIQLYGRNNGAFAGFGAEIYSATSLTQLTAATTSLEAGVIWSTADVIGGHFDIAGASGYTCPEGYFYNSCGEPICSKITKISINDTCVDNWDIRFLKYDGCDYRYLTEFDPSSATTIYFSGYCGNTYIYDNCNCFYVGIGYRGPDIYDHYSVLNLFLTDNTSSGINQLSYELHGRSSINFTGGRSFNLITQTFIDLPVPIESDCPEAPSCNCLSITTGTTSNGGYPVNIGGESYYQYNVLYSLINTCYTEFQLKYLQIFPYSYSGLTIDYSNFNGTLGKNETATLSLNYLSQTLDPIYGSIQYSGYTYDPFSCMSSEIGCVDYLYFQFIPKPASIGISDNNYNFGGVGVGCCSQHLFTVQNTGDAGLTITGLELTNSNFTILTPAIPFTSLLHLGPLNTFDVTIEFCSPTGCTDGTISTTDLVLYTVEYGNISASTLGNNFSISATCVNPPISGSPDSLIFIKTTDQQILSGLTLCNRTNLEQTVQISNCIQLQTGTTETTDSLDHGFEIVVETETTSNITFPRSVTIPPNDCVDVEIRYDTPYPDKVFCSIYLEDNCSNLYEIPFTGYSLPLPIEITTYNYTDPICHGESNGTVTISFSGGVAPYTYIFSGDSVYNTGTIYTTSILFNNLPATDAGTDYIFFLSGDPCNGTVGVPDLSPFILPGSPEIELLTPLIVTLIQPSYFEITNISYTALTCLVSGSVSATVTGGTTPYNFEWVTGVIESGGTTPYTSYITNLVAGAYSVVVTDGNGCQRIDSIDIPDLLPITLVPEIIDVSCYGGTNGQINITVFDAVDPVSYYWSGLTYDGYNVYPSHTDAYTSTTSNTLTAGTYYIEYVDANSCSGNTELNVYQPNSLDFDISSSNVTCSYLTNGIIDFYIITGGTQPYYIYASGDTFSYSSDTSTVLNGLDSGYYNTYVIDYNGCQTGYKNVVITKPDPLSLTYSYTATTCFESSDGMLLLSVTGGTPPYYYLWTNTDSTTNYVTGATYGNYYVTIFDNNGCELSTGFTMPYNTSYCTNVYWYMYDENNDPLQYFGSSSVIAFPYTCYSSSYEKIITFCQYSPCNITIIGYSGITTNINDFYLGSEILGVTVPSSGCTTISFVFNPTSATTYITTFSAITHYCTHEFILSGTGVSDIISGDTQYLDFGNVCYGTATTLNLNITNLTPDNRIITIQTTPTEFNTPYSTFILSGNTTETIPYTFTPSYTPTTPIIWSKEFTGTTKLTNCPTLEVYLSGTGYGGHLYVSDLNFGCVNYNCYSDQTVTVYNYHCLPVGITSASVLSPYLTILNFSATTVDPGGTMTFDVRYSALTSITSFITVHTNFNLAGTLMSGITACVDNTLSHVVSPGLITTIPGVPTFTNVDVTNITTSTLFITANITNSTGGTPTDIFVFPPMIVLPSPVLPLTSTTTNFVLIFNDVNPVNETYYLNLSDICGNHVTLPFNVYSQPIGYYGIVLDPSCYGDSNGYIEITPTGGTSPYTVIWDIGFTGTTLSNLSADTYNFTVGDSNGNSSSFSITLTDPNPLGMSYVIPSNGSYNVLVYGYNTGYIDITVTGGTTAYTYNWIGVTFDGQSFSSSDEDITGLFSGDYYLTVSDSNGCSISNFITLNQPNPITIILTNCIPPVPPATTCNITGTTLEISVSGGQCPYYVIVCPTSPQNPLFSPGGQYYGYTSCQILPDCSVVPSGTTCVTSICYCCDGSVSPCLSGSCPCVNCDITINNLPPGSYPPGSFGVIDINSGTTYYSGGTWVPNLSTLGFELLQTATTCNVICDGMVDAMIIPTQNQIGQWGMGSPPYTYYLNGVQYGLPTMSIEQLFTGLCPNIYVVTVVDNDSNSISHSINVTQGRLMANISTTSETLQNGDGSIIINTITGGVGPYTASLNSWASVTVSDGYVFENLSAGNYVIEIVDSIGCRYTAKTRITRTIPLETGQEIFGKKASVSNQTIYDKRLGGFKLIKKIPNKKNR